ncbi:uncharacterized protein BYT42DRAFT_554635 [Radiomyces spectabilis]|uniref:uncharacterized protein n=1 Tax=Radiomyces spectabilis TaxID=64574 RepID=UPI0022210717|nr:uncharacterized protein BYT42DRAFT_554635 [Radiomyces spectabilis]KAI8390869.1 hypothetical protein BYT42DRAFT_554635 [Radiomyces spectabilis]
MIRRKGIWMHNAWFASNGFLFFLFYFSFCHAALFYGESFNTKSSTITSGFHRGVFYNAWAFKKIRSENGILQKQSNKQVSISRTIFLFTSMSGRKKALFNEFGLCSVCIC